MNPPSFKLPLVETTDFKIKTIRSGSLTTREKYGSIVLSSSRKLEDDMLGSDILKSMNFALNPQIHYHRKKQKNLQNVVIEQLKSQVSDISKVNKNLLAMKKKKELTNTAFCPSLTVKPKLKQSRSVVGGTISMLFSGDSSARFPNAKKSGAEFVKAGEVDISQKARAKIRLEMVNWLIENKKAVVSKINENKQIMIAWVVYLNYIDRNEFGELLTALGISYDANMFERLFKLFDLDDDGVIDQKEILATLELFKEHSFEDKLQMFFELVDDDRRGYIDEEKLVKFFRKNLKSEEEMKKVRPAVRILMTKELNPSSRGGVTLGELTKACELNSALKAVVESNVTYAKPPSKPKVKINSTNIIATQLQLGQGGFSLPYMNRLIGAFEEKSQISQRFVSLQKDYSKTAKYLKEISGGKDTTQENDVI